MPFEVQPSIFSMPTVVGEKDCPITERVKEAFGPYANNSASYRLWNELVEATKTDIAEAGRNTHKAVAAQAIIQMTAKVLANENGYAPFFYIMEAALLLKGDENE